MTIVFNVQSKILMDDPRLKPKPAGEMLPAWKTSIAGRLEKGLEQGGTVRACPAIHDYLHLGYSIPLWTDVLVERVSVGLNGQPVRDAKGTKLSWRTAHAAFPLEHHGIDQVKGVTPLEPPDGMPLVIKPICPWLIETPPGWSILVLPFSLHEEGETLPLEPIIGVVNTDHWHQVHAPCRWKSDGASVKMKAGTPFMHIIPFRRDDALTAEFKLIEEDARLANLAGVLNDFSGSYRKQQKVHDNKRRPPQDQE
ncbi:MAG: hypothetical protein AAFY83_12320 [Pseudomonadota bacterium]